MPASVVLDVARTAAALTATLAAVLISAAPARAYELRVIELPLAPAAYASRVLVADVTGDGHLDVVVGFTDASRPGREGPPGGLIVVPGNGSGGFVSSATLELEMTPMALAAGDFTGDGVADVVASGGVAGGTTYSLTVVSALRAAPAIRTTLRRRQYDRCASPLDKLAPEDIDADGALDLVVTTGVPSRCGFLGDGDGTLKPWLHAFATKCSAALGDFNGDLRLDVVTADDRSEPAVALGRGGGRFTSARSLAQTPEDGSACEVAVGDLDRDGRLDLVSDASVYRPGRTALRFDRGRGHGTFDPPTLPWVDARGGFFGIELGDVTADRRLDVYGLAPARGQLKRPSLTWLVGDGHGGFQFRGAVHLPNPSGGPPVLGDPPVAGGDLDADQRVDLVGISPGGRSVIALRRIPDTVVMRAASSAHTVRAGSSLTVAIDLAASAVVTVKLIDLQGRSYSRQRAALGDGRSQLELALPETLSPSRPYRVWVHANRDPLTETRQLPVTVRPT